MSNSRIQLLLAIIIAIGCFFIFDLQHYLTLASLKSQHLLISDYRDSHPFMTTMLYALIYIAVTGLSLPGASILTLAGGALFGVLWGTVVVSFASTIGATLAFLAARFLFRDAVRNHYKELIESIDTGIAKDGAYYLFTLRLIPIFPFFIINLVMGLTQLKTLTFFWVSQIGMLAGTIVYVNAGTQLAKVESISGLLSPALVGSFTLLGIFPLIAKKILEYLPHN